MIDCDNNLIIVLKFADRQLCQIMSDLFSAGQETVKTTLQWGILFMLHNPDVQAKIQEELDAVVGRKRDRKSVV